MSPFYPMTQQPEWQLNANLIESHITLPPPASQRLWGIPLVLGWNSQAPRAWQPLLPSLPHLAPRPGSLHLPCRLSPGSMDLLLALLTQGLSSFGCFYLEPTTHHFTWLIPIHSSGLSSNVTCSGGLCWGPQPRSGLPVTNSHNSVVSLLHSMQLYTYLWSSLSIAYIAFPGTWSGALSVRGLVSQTYSQYLTVSSSVEVLNKWQMNE